MWASKGHFFIDLELETLAIYYILYSIVFFLKKVLKTGSKNSV